MTKRAMGDKEKDRPTKINCCTSGKLHLLFVKACTIATGKVDDSSISLLSNFDRL